MSIESKNINFPLLQDIEDYPRWARHAEAKLKSQNCHEAILPITATNYDAAIQHFRGLGFTGNAITGAMIFSWIEKQRSKQEERESKAVGILKKLVGAKNKHYIEGKSASEIWNTLRNMFKDTSPMGQMEVIRKAGRVRMADFTSPSLYCNTYKAALDQLCGMLEPHSLINRKAAEALLQGFMLFNLTEIYMPLITKFRMEWTTANTDLSKACLSIEEYYIPVNDGNASKAFHVTPTKNPNRKPKGTCDFDECVKAGITTHYKDKCWRKHPELRPKFALNKMKTKGVTNEESSTPHRATAPPPDIIC